VGTAGRMKTSIEASGAAVGGEREKGSRRSKVVHICKERRGGAEHSQAKCLEIGADRADRTAVVRRERERGLS